MKDVCVIIRSTSERTEEACRSALQEIFNQEPVIIKTSPFSKALKESLIAGISSGKQYTYIFDADTLPLRKGVLKLLDEMKSCPELFEIQGMVMDKFFFAHRPAGVHLYRTDLISTAVNFIPDEKESKRPETSMIKAMAKEGFPWKQSDVLVGLHDFEQDYDKIYRTAWFHAIKHSHKWRKFFLQEWRKWALHDPDYKVALGGLIMGIISNKDITSDINCLSYETKVFYKQQKITPKKPLEGLNELLINNILTEFTHRSEFIDTQKKQGKYNTKKSISTTDKLECIILAHLLYIKNQITRQST